jgi:hypothetical protein
VNAWQFAEQPLPDGTGPADWVCTRAETWRGDGTAALAQFRTPGGATGAVVAKGTDVRDCGPRDPEVLAGVLWKSAAGHWFLLAAGGADTATISAGGGITAAGQGPLLVARAQQGAKATLKGTLEGGRAISGLH